MSSDLPSYQPFDPIQPAAPQPSSEATGSTQATGSTATDTATQEITPEISTAAEAARVQPIPPPTEDKQYRAIGLIRGRYVPSEEQFTRGVVITEEGSELDAVLLGRVMHLVRHRLELDQDHLWVVYPRTREREEQLHIQIMGVWAPEEMGQSLNLHPTPETLPDYFSIRGEVVFQSKESSFVIVKIRRAKQPQEEKAQAFNLRLEGQLPHKGVGGFWAVEARRQGSHLQIESAIAIDKPRPRLVDRSQRKRRPPTPAHADREDRPPGRSNPLPKPILKGKQ